MGSYFDQHGRNPFDGILCMPYYLIWITIIIAWFLGALQFFYLKQIPTIRSKIIQKEQAARDEIKHKLIKQYFENIEIALQEEYYTNIKLPPDITKIVMSMMGKDLVLYNSEINKPLSKYHFSEMKFALKYSIFIYPLIRIICNMINFVFIMKRYSEWHKQHKSMSGWDKYNAFIMCLFYLPLWKGSGLCNIMGSDNDYIGNEVPVSDYLYNIGSLETVIFIFLFCAISFPVIIGGLFIYIPNSLLTMFTVILLWFRLSYIKDSWRLVMIVTFLLNFFCTVIVVATMEVYAGNKWVDGYEIAVLGNYCKHEDYVDFGEWEKYPNDIQFLIVSWLLF